MKPHPETNSAAEGAGMCLRTALVLLLVSLACSLPLAGATPEVPVPAGTGAGASFRAAASVAELRRHLADARPGDTIRLAAGVYDVADGALATAADGTAAACITLEGAEGGATLRWTAPADRACLTIRHSYHRIRNIAIDANGRSKRGVLVENASHGMLVKVTVRNTNQEAFKLRRNSRYWLVEDCVAEDTGRSGEYGEGFYCGDAQANWATGGEADRTGHIAFHRCTARRTMADGFDCKEGTHHIRIVGCTVDFEARPVDGKYGNNGVFTRANGIQIVDTTVRNNRHATATGAGVWVSRKKARDGRTYGEGVEIKGLRCENLRGCLYSTMDASTTLYSDSSSTGCAGVRDPQSPGTARERPPSAFRQMTWEGEGGGAF